MRGPGLHELLVLNIALQVFDGVATLHGLCCWNEGNPLIRAGIETLGPTQALALAKAQACGSLVLVRRLARPVVAGTVLAAGAGAYFGLSFVPWMARLLSLAWA
ncbi:MAG TPA: hypothetical protein VNO26_15565 [Candidatus Limnocylindria bacterium]|nr:hypothetical protein [Candidatus Limnocylindria bacterium]